METIKVLIVEDELLIAEDLSKRLERHSLKVVGTCPSGEEALELSDSLRPDLILMDIRLSGRMDGIATARLIHERQDVPIIYLTDHVDPETVARAKETMPANYLAKPFQEGDLVRAIDLAFYNARMMARRRNTILNDYLFLRKNNQTYVRIAANEIVYLHAKRAYCDIICEGATHIMSTSMNHVNEQIGRDEFIKIHRSAIVNANKITGIDGNIVKLGAYEVQMSREYRDQLLQCLKLVK